MKDNFSAQSALYVRFRPQYPPALAEWLAAQAPARMLAWDCATGNGQMALLLAPYFEKVIATDLSAQQLENAPPHPAVEYRCEVAETSSLVDASVDLLVVAQAAHWFDFERFHTEARRVLRDGGVLAFIGYPLCRVLHPPVDAVLQHFYYEVIHAYWDAERHHLDEAYASLPFPWPEIPFPDFYMTYTWDFDTFCGYLRTWSAVQHFIRRHGDDPVTALEPALRAAWGETGAHTFRFSLVGRIGQKDARG